jgi:hypothetical protein
VLALARGTLNRSVSSVVNNESANVFRTAKE